MCPALLKGQECFNGGCCTYARASPSAHTAASMWHAHELLAPLPPMQHADLVWLSQTTRASW